MKKRLLPALLALAMILSLLPGQALATGSIEATVEGHTIRVANPNDTYYKNYDGASGENGPWDSVELTASKDTTNSQGSTAVYDVTLKATNLVSHDSSSDQADPKNAYWLGIAFPKPTATSPEYYQSVAEATADLDSGITWSPKMTAPDGIAEIGGKEYAGLYFLPNAAMIENSTTQRAYIKVVDGSNITIYRINYEGTTLKPKTITEAKATLDVGTVEIGGALPEAELTSVAVDGVVEPITSSFESVATITTTWTKKGETEKITGTFPEAGEYTYTISVDAVADYVKDSNVAYTLSVDADTLTGNQSVMTGTVTIEAPEPVEVTAVSVKLDAAHDGNKTAGDPLPEARITGFAAGDTTIGEENTTEIEKLGITTTWTTNEQPVTEFTQTGDYTYTIVVDAGADSGYKMGGNVEYTLTVDTDPVRTGDSQILTGTVHYTVGDEPPAPADPMVISAVAVEMDVANAKANAPLPQAKVTGITLDGEQVTDAAEIAKAADITVTTTWKKGTDPVEGSKFGETGEYTYTITVDAVANDGYEMGADAAYTLTVDVESFDIEKTADAYTYEGKLTVAESNIKPVESTGSDGALTVTEIKKDDVTAEIGVAKEEGSALVIDVVSADPTSTEPVTSVSAPVKQEVLTELLKTEGGAQKAGLTVQVDNLGSVTLEPEALQVVFDKGGTSVTVDIAKTDENTQLPDTVETTDVKASIEVTVKVDDNPIKDWGSLTEGAIMVTVPLADDLQGEGKTFDIYVDDDKLTADKFEVSDDYKTVTITMPHLSVISQVATTVQEYTIKFEADEGATGSISDAAVTKEATGATSYTLPADATGFTAPGGKQFKEWTLKTEVTGVSISDDGTTLTIAEEVDPATEITLLATWEVKELDASTDVEYTPYKSTDAGYETWLSGHLKLKNLEANYYYLIQVKAKGGDKATYQVVQANASGEIDVIAQAGATLQVALIGESNSNLGTALLNSGFILETDLASASGSGR